MTAIEHIWNVHHTPLTTSSQVLTPLMSDRSIHSRLYILLCKDCWIFPRAEAVIPAMPIKRLLTFLLILGKYARKQLLACLDWMGEAGSMLGSDFMVPSANDLEVDKDRNSCKTKIW